MKKGSRIGVLEEVTRIGKDDELWKEHSQEKVRVCQTAGPTETRQQELCSRLQFGDTSNRIERGELKNLLSQYPDIFALSDDELGETEIVHHVIDTGNSPPVHSTPRRLPYALRK